MEQRIREGYMSREQDHSGDDQYSHCSPDKRSKTTGCLDEPLLGFCWVRISFDQRD